MDLSQSWENHRKHKLIHVEPKGLAEGKCKLLANVAMSVLLYEAPIGAEASTLKIEE